MATKIETVKCSWADMEDQDEEERSIASSFSSSVSSPSVQKLSYALIASKGVAVDNDNACDNTCGISDTASSSASVDDTVSDFSDFTVVSYKKKQTMKKCESAILHWAKTKGQSQAQDRSRVTKPISKCDEIICNRCALPFVFNAKTKQKYAEKGWKTPKICKVCSQMRFEDRKI